MKASVVSSGHRAVPGRSARSIETFDDIDVRGVLPAITAPTLVVHATGDTCVPVGNGRWLAEHIAGAQLVEMDGNHVNFDVDRFADEVETFLTGRRRAVATDRVLSTVMFSDIVGSTERAAAVGDRRWSDVLDRHDAVVSREIGEPPRAAREVDR